MGDALVELAKVSPYLAGLVAAIGWGPKWVKVLLQHRRKMLKFKKESARIDKEVKRAIKGRKKGGKAHGLPPGRSVPHLPPPTKGGKSSPSKAKK